MAETVVPFEGRAAARRKAAAGASLDQLHGLVAEDLRAVNGVILDNMQSSVMLISELAAHIVAAGGKRLRPMLTLGAARLCGYTGKRHIDLAACIEFIHTATLLHGRCCRRQCAAAGHGNGERGLGQQAECVGRRLSVQPRLSNLRRGRFAPRARHPCRYRRDPRRGRGDAAHHLQRHRDQRGRLSQCDYREDCGALRRRLPARRGGGRAPRRRGRGAQKPRPQPRHRLSAGG